MTKESKIDESKFEPKAEKSGETTWIINLEEDPTTGDLVLPLPEELLKSAGWEIGDTLVWDIDGETAILTKKNDVG